MTRRKGVTFETVCRLGAELPEVIESTSYGTPALKVRGALVARLKEDGVTLVIRCDMVSRDMLLKAEPELFFITDHYKDYPAVLLRMNRVSERRMRELLEDSWRFVAPKKLAAAYDARASRKTP